MVIFKNHMYPGSASDGVTDNVPGRLLWRKHAKFGPGPFLAQKKNWSKRPGLLAHQIIGWRIKLSWLGPFLARPLFFLLALLARVTASSVHSRLRRRTSPWPRRCGLFCSEIKVVTRLDREVSRRVECPRPTVLDTGTEQIVVMKCSARGTSSVYEGSGPSCPGSR